MGSPCMGESESEPFPHFLRYLTLLPNQNFPSNFLTVCEELKFTANLKTLRPPHFRPTSPKHLLEPRFCHASTPLLWHNTQFYSPLPPTRTLTAHSDTANGIGLNHAKTRQFGTLLGIPTARTLSSGPLHTRPLLGRTHTSRTRNGPRASH